MRAAGTAVPSIPPPPIPTPMAAALPPFTRAEFERSERVLLGRGRWPKSEVWRARIRGEDWVVKDFRPREFIGRHLVGVPFVRRDLRALQRLDGIPGVPPGGFRVDRYALAYRFLPGRPLANVPLKEQPQEFFLALERTLKAVHERGIVHLDIRNCRNVLINERNEPVLIDFEAHLDTTGWLRGQRERLERFDLAGAYKHWHRALPSAMGAERVELLERMNRWRKAWVLRGLWYYPRSAGKALRKLLRRAPGDTKHEARL